MADTLKPEGPTPAPRPTPLDRIPERKLVLDHKGDQDPGQTHIEHIVMGTSTNNETGVVQIGFRARCVIVDNFTNQYIYIASGNTWVPPYVVGYRVLISPTTTGRATTNTTGSTTGRGVAQAVAISGEICVVTFCERVVLSVPIAVDVPAGEASTGTILDGRQIFTATTGATTLISVPAGKTWVGTIGASCATANAGAAAIAAEATAIFTTSGAGVLPAAGTVFGVHCLVGANVAAGTVGDDGEAFGSTPFVITAPAANAVAIQVASTNAGTSSVVDAFAVGTTN